MAQTTWSWTGQTYVIGGILTQNYLTELINRSTRRERVIQGNSSLEPSGELCTRLIVITITFPASVVSRLEFGKPRQEERLSNTFRPLKVGLWFYSASPDNLITLLNPVIWAKRRVGCSRVDGCWNYPHWALTFLSVASPATSLSSCTEGLIGKMKTFQ